MKFHKRENLPTILSPSLTGNTSCGRDVRCQVVLVTDRQGLSLTGSRLDRQPLSGCEESPVLCVLSTGIRGSKENSSTKEEYCFRSG